jgi:hypothetical protein
MSGIRSPSQDHPFPKTSIEWALGVYMLIHFILAVKNNLPFILPFLGVVD